MVRSEKVNHLLLCFKLTLYFHIPSLCDLLSVPNVPEVFVFALFILLDSGSYESMFFLNNLIFKLRY